MINVEYDEAMEARNHAYIVAARECFNYMPQDEGECNPDDFYATFEWHACFSYAILWGLYVYGRGAFVECI